MTPYYSRPDVTLYLGDCREVVTSLPRESVDLMVTDPPYGVEVRSGPNRTTGARFKPMVGDDDAAWVPTALEACLRPLRNYRHIYVFGRFDLSALPVGSWAELIWNKVNGGMGGQWVPQHEYIQFGMLSRSKANRERGDGRLAARLRRGTVLTVPRLNSRACANHLTEKPTLLLRQLIESSSVIDETVFDPFAGSGSTLEAALMEGRRAIGIEIDERYAEGIARRLDHWGTAN